MEVATLAEHAVGKPAVGKRAVGKRAVGKRAVGKSAVRVKVNVDNTRDNIYYVNTEIYDFP